MSVEITSVTIGSIVDKRLTLGNSQWAATLDMGTDWTTLRIGCRVAFDDTGTNLIVTPKHYFGVLASPASGMTNGPIGSLTSHFLGVSSVGATWTRATTVPSRIRYGSGLQIWGFRKKILTTETTLGTLFDNWYSAEPTVARNAMIFEVTKGTPNFTVSFIKANPAATEIDIPYSIFVDAMSLPTMANAVTYLNNTAGSGYYNEITTGAVSESTSGYFNSICCAWDRSVPLHYVSEMLFAKMA